MTEIGPLAVEGDVTMEEFRSALEYVLDNT